MGMHLFIDIRLPLALCLLVTGGCVGRNMRRGKMSQNSIEIYRLPTVSIFKDGHKGALALFGLPNINSIVESLRGKRALIKQLENIKIYIASYGFNNPIVSHYPVDNQKTSEVKQKGASAVDSIKPSPLPSEIIQEFFKLFENFQDESDKNISRHKAERIRGVFPKVVLYFMDPNSCAAYVEDLRRGDNAVKMQNSSLNTYVEKIMDESRKFEPIMLPLPEALIHATNGGNCRVKGTPIFTTEPPIVKTTAEDVKKRYYCPKDVILVFFSPKEAMEFYRKAWWKSSMTITVNDKTEYYKIVGNLLPWNPEIKSTSFESICGKIYGTEPYWGYILQFVAPVIAPDKNAGKNIEQVHTFLWKISNAFKHLKSLL